MKTFIKLVLSVLFFFMLMPMLLKLTEGPAITSNFEQDAPRFHVLGIKDGEYEVLSLAEAQDSNDAYQFRIEGKTEIRLNEENLVEVLENDAMKQRIRYFYSNTTMTESIYEVSDNAVVPKEYRVLGSMGFVGLYLVLFVIAAVVATLLAELVIWQWKRWKTGNSNA